MIAALHGKDVVVTGVDGFVGRHVARLAHEAGARVHGIARAGAAPEGLRPVLASYHGADLRRAWPDDVRCDVIVHLAGRAAVGPSFRSPQRYIADNSAIVTTMCEDLLRVGRPVRVIGVSSGAVYAPVAHGDAVDESAPTRASSPYAVSKLLLETQLEYYRLRGLDTVVARPFNHIGPGQGSGFLVPDLRDRLRSLRGDEPLVVGDLGTARDYTDVRDVARAYLELAVAPRLSAGTYNIASGRATTGTEMLALLCAALGRPVPALRVDPDLVRPADPREIVGSADRLRAETPWAPRYSLADSVSAAVA